MYFFKIYVSMSANKTDLSSVDGNQSQNMQMAIDSRDGWKNSL